MRTSLHHTAHQRHTKHMPLTHTEHTRSFYTNKRAQQPAYKLPPHPTPPHRSAAAAGRPIMAR